MTEETDSYRGIVLKESLIDGVLPPAARRCLVEEYPYALDGKEPMTVFRLELFRDIPPVIVRSPNALILHSSQMLLCSDSVYLLRENCGRLVIAARFG